jgi:hypothetical protein
LSPPQAGGDKKKAPGACFGCGSDGHRASDCPNPSAEYLAKKAAGGNGGACFACGNEGHRASDCPNPNPEYAGKGKGKAPPKSGKKGGGKGDKAAKDFGPEKTAAELDAEMDSYFAGKAAAADADMTE